jgi:hypothetical protein
MSEGRSVEQWLTLAASVAAPAGAVAALLFYFGYASTRAKYEYYGIDIDVVGLGTRDVLMRSPQPLFVPLVVLAVLALLAVSLHLAVRGVIEARAGEDPANEQRRGKLLLAAGAVEVAGAAVLAAGMTLLLTAAWLSGWAAYDLVTPLCLLIGMLLFTYGRHVRTDITNRNTSDVDTAPLRRTVWILCAFVVAGSAFWATSTLAEWSGRGQAVRLSHHFGDLPRVILDTKERLYIQNEVIQETLLPPRPGQTMA